MEEVKTSEAAAILEMKEAVEAAVAARGHAIFAAVVVAVKAIERVVEMTGWTDIAREQWCVFCMRF